MNDRNYRTLNEFVQKYIVYNQTYLVDNILKDDKEMKHYNNLHNHSYFREQLSDGLFIGGIDTFCKKQEDIQKRIKLLTGIMNKEQFEPQSTTQRSFNKEIASLKQDIEILENAQTLLKNAFEWWLVPYWLAERLKEQDEVILRIYSCNWWGRSSIEKPLYRERVLFNICQELGFSSFKT